MPIGTGAKLFAGRSCMRALPASATAALTVLLGWACGNTPSTVVTCAVNSVTVTANPTSVNTGATATLLATVSAGPSCAGGVTWSASPVGGTLTASGLTATFSAAAVGTYTVSAASIDDPAKSGAATVMVTASAPPCGQAGGTVITHSVNVGANESWAGDGVTHLVPGSISITGNATVTIDPCAIVALGAGASITVRDNAKLVAAGTGSARFIVFRRNVANQAWGSLRGFSATSLIDLTWTTLQGGGALGSMSDPTIAVAGNGYGSPTVPVLRVDNVTIQMSQGVGVYLDANGAFTTTSKSLVVTASGGRPVVTTMMSLGSLPSGTYTGNGTDEILIAGPSANVFADMTVEDRGVPVRIAYGTMSIAPAFGATAPVTLTLRPGVIFRFPRLGQQAAPGTRVTFGTNGNAPNNLVGVLNAIGTAAKPIVFTSGELVPAPGDWVGVWLNTANGSRLDYVEISYAGAPSGIQSSNCRPTNTTDDAALLVGSFSTQYVPPATLITNSRITNSAGFGINAMWQAASVNSTDLTATNVFQGNARCRQTYNGLVPPGVCPVGGGCTAA